MDDFDLGSGGEPEVPADPEAVTGRGGVASGESRVAGGEETSDAATMENEAPHGVEADGDVRSAPAVSPDDGEPQTSGDGQVIVEFRDNTVQGRGFELVGQKNVYASEEVERLDAKEFQRLDVGDLLNDVRGAMLDDAVVESGLRCLQKHRVLCIAGEAEIGKGTFARSLVSTLADRGRLSGALVHRGLSRRVRVRLATFVAQVAPSGHAQRAIVIEDALSGANRDLTTWLANLNEGELAALTGKLRTVGYLLLTSDTELWSPFDDSLRRLGLLVTLPGPGFRVLKETILKELADSMSAESGLQERVSQLLDAHQERLHAVLRTIPRARRFTRRHLPAILEMDGEEDELEATLDRFDDTGSELLEVLSDDLEAGCALLALAVAQSDPGQHGVDWYDFDRLRRALSMRLRRRLNRGDEALTTGDLLTPYTRDLGIEIRRGVYPAGDRAQFQDHHYGERIWRTFQTSGRGISAILIPELVDLMRAADDRLRSLAATALGRLGRSSPSTLIHPLIGHCMEAREEHLRDTLAELFRGIAFSGEQMYLDGCLEKLSRRLIEATNAEKALAFGRSLREVGLVEVDTAVEHLVEILRQGSLHQKLDDLKKLNLLAQAVRGVMASEQIDLRLAVREVLQENFGSGEAHLLNAVKYPLVGLCLGLGPPACLAALMPYLDGEDRAVARLLTLLCLAPKGLLDFLDDWSERMPGDQRDPPPRIPLLLAAVHNSEGGASQMAAVYEELVGVASDFPNPLRTYLRRHPLRLMRRWCRALDDVPEVEEDLRTMLDALLRSRHTELREETFQMLQREDLFRRTGTPQERLSHDVLARSVLDADADRPA